MPHPRIMFRLHPQSSLLCLNIFDHFRITLYSSHQYRYHQLGSQCQCSRPRIGSFLFKYLMCVYTRDIQSFPCPRSFKKMQIASIACPRNPIPLQCFAAAMDAHVQARLVLGHVRARSGVLWASIFFLVTVQSLLHRRTCEGPSKRCDQFRYYKESLYIPYCGPLRPLI